MEPGHEIDYQRLVAEALVGVVRRVLAAVAEDGLPAAHHFFLTFATEAAGVEMPEALRQSYPREMTVVLQHRFYDLVVDDDGFAVTLEFGGRAERLRVPWPALTAFVDPAAEIGFRFGPEAAEPGGDPERAGGPAPGADSPESADNRESADNVVPLDRFRRPRDG